MSFVSNAAQQLTLFDALGFFNKRKLQAMKNSWAQPFSDHVFAKIDEHIFAPLYSEKANSRPNAPINVLAGALILKEFKGLTDDELIDSCLFDQRFQYALHTTSFEDQPISGRSLSRFRSRLAEYELTTGEDLLHECFVKMAEGLREYMDISPGIRRMDSMMVESHIRKMGRLELLYACLANLVTKVAKDGRDALIEGLEDYTKPDNKNRIIYHDSDTPQSERLQKVIDDAAAFLPKCREAYGETTDCQLLERAINEQTKKDENGNSIPKGKGDGMDSTVLQNPSDPDATCREKAGKAHRGYAANITEAVDKNGSVITDYQYDVNIRSDVDFLRETIRKEEPSESGQMIIADGAYASEELAIEAADKSIAIVTTGLRGGKPREILTEFELSEDGRRVARCPEGNAPKSSSYSQSARNIRVSFPRECCEKCPHREECKVTLKPRTAVMFLSIGARDHAKEAMERKDDEGYRLIGRIRNGAETIPSLLRRKYHVDRMPVRGKLKTKVFFGFKMCAINFTKLWLHDRGLEKCRTLTEEYA